MQAEAIHCAKEIGWADIKSQYLTKKEEIHALMDRVFSEANFVNSKSVDLLEQEIAEYVGVKYAVCVNSGTDALIFAMRGLGIGAGDEVITPPNSFIASTSSVAHVGAMPVFVDVCEDQNIDPEKIEAAITKKTKAIMVVHLTGRIAKMKEILAIANKHGLFVIEDAAQSFGSKYEGKFSGSIADAGCFSVHPLKVFNSAGDGGFITTNNADVYAKANSLRNHGLVDRATAMEWGYVSRMNSFQAELLRMRLANELEPSIAQRRKNAVLYNRLLDRKNIFIPSVPEEVFHTYQCFVIQVSRRDELQHYLDKQGIKTAVHYPIPIHLQPAAQYLGYKQGDFPCTEQQAKSILTIPVHQYLGEKEISYISHLINEFYV